jgi:hypothetical protein
VGCRHRSAVVGSFYELASCVKDPAKRARHPYDRKVSPEAEAKQDPTLTRIRHRQVVQNAIPGDCLPSAV